MSIQYPQWQDVGIPPRLVQRIRQLSGPMLDYLVLNKVFRFHVKPQYTYTCQKCGHAKKLGRPYEDYSSCQKCHSNNLLCVVGWRMGKDQVRAFTSSGDGHVYAPKMLAQMANAYRMYFGQALPDDFFKSGWVFDESFNASLNGDITSILEDISEDSEDNDFSEPQNLPSDAKCAAQFIGGEKVECKSFPLAVAKAAILCPFLWDDKFDWKFGLKKDDSRQTHIIPLFHIWSKYRKSSTPSLRGKKGILKMPKMDEYHNESVFQPPPDFASLHPSNSIIIDDNGSVLDNDKKIINDIVDSLMSPVSFI